MCVLRCQITKTDTQSRLLIYLLLLSSSTYYLPKELAINKKREKKVHAIHVI